MSARARHDSFSTTGTTTLTPSAAALAGLKLRNGTSYAGGAAISLATITGLPGPYVVLGAYPALPAGLTASCTGTTPPGTVLLSGQPTAVAGSATWSLSVSNTVASAPRSVSFVLQVAATLTASQAVPVVAWSQNAAITPVSPVTVSGGYAPYTWSVAPTLPAGLTMNASTGSITGTPTAAVGSTVYTVTALDTVGGTNGSVSASFTASVTASGGTGPITAAQWAEIAIRRASWGDPNDAKARVDALPTTGTVLAAGGNITTAIAGVANGGTVLLQTGTYTPTGSLLSVPSGKKLVAGPGQTPVVDLSQLTNAATVYIGNGSVIANIDFKNAQGISIVTFDTVAGVYSNAGTTGLIYNCKTRDSGLTGAMTDGTGISISGGGAPARDRGRNWCVVACEAYNCWNPAGGVNANGANSDGMASHFAAGDTTFIGCNSHNNGDDGIDMWQSDITYHYFCQYHDNGKVANVTNGGDGNGVKLGTGDCSHKFYKSTADTNRTGGFNLNGNAQQPTFDQSTASGNPGGNYINGVNPP